MIPLRWMVVGASALVLAAGVGYYGQTRYKAGQDQVQARWDAEKVVTAQLVLERAAEVTRLAAERDVLSRRIDNELTPKLAAADAASLDLARRLRNYQIIAGRCAVSRVAEASGEADDPSGEPPDASRARAVDAALAAHLAACGRDAVRLDEWQTWWMQVNGSM